MLFFSIDFQPNQVLKFTDSGDAIDTIAKQKVSDEGREYDSLSTATDGQASSGINIEQAKKVLKAEDAFDRRKEKERIKERHKEQKRKEKEMKNSRRKEKEEAKAAESVDDAEVRKTKLIQYFLFSMTILAFLFFSFSA